MHAVWLLHKGGGRMPENAPERVGKEMVADVKATI